MSTEWLDEWITSKEAKKSMSEGERKYGDVKFADPANDKYPIDTEEHVRAAWSYINMPDNARKYDAKVLAAIKGRIKAAAKKFGIEIKGQG